MRRTSILDGMSVQTLQAQLATMQQAYLDIVSGNKGESYSYTQGEGAKAVTYTRANAEGLTTAILVVQTQIDRLNGVHQNRRRPLHPIF